MAEINRRTFVGASVAGLSALGLPSPLHAAAQCVSGSLPGFLPAMLSVDCASKHNFRTFRQNPKLVGLAGVVSMSFVRGSQGTYTAGNLFLFPWLKPKARGKSLPALMPINGTQFVNASPIPDGTLPVDEYFVSFVLQAPWTSFIGFQVDDPFSASQATLDWCTKSTSSPTARAWASTGPAPISITRGSAAATRFRTRTRAAGSHGGGSSPRGSSRLRSARVDAREHPMRRAYVIAAAAAALLAALAAPRFRLAPWTS